MYFTGATQGMSGSQRADFKFQLIYIFNKERCKRSDENKQKAMKAIPGSLGESKQVIKKG